jgi:hypothetical protein
MLQGLPIEVKPCFLLAAPRPHQLVGRRPVPKAACLQVQHTHGAGRRQGWAHCATCACIRAYLAHKRALARLRLSKAAIQINMQLDVAYTRQWCTRGCDEATDTEHHLLFECPALADVRAAFPDDELLLADGDLGRLMDEVYHLRQWRLF